MADVINLRLARKARTRAEKAALAATNRLKHGETRGARLARQAEDVRASSALDGARRDQD